MRVALVTPDLRRASGGPAVSVIQLAEALAREGADVELHTAGEAPRPCAARLSILAAPSAWPRRLGRSPELRAGLLASTADVIHANGLWMLPLRHACQAAQRRSVPLVISPRGMLAPWALRRSPLRKRLAALVVHPGAFQAAAGWHATAEMEEQDIRAFGLAQPVCVAPNGIAAVEQDPEPVRLHYLDAAQALRGKRILLFYSRFHSKKRIRELLRDFAGLAPRHPGWHLLAVGIPEEYSVESLRAEARHLGIEHVTTILDGSRAPAPYALADLFILPTHSENFGQVVAEALAQGVPVLTTTSTPWGRLDAVGAGRCVALTDMPRTLGELMAVSRDRLREMGARGREWVLEEFDWGATARRLLDFYESLRSNGAA